MAIEAGIIDPLLSILKFNHYNLNEEELNHASEACKVAIKVIIKFSHGCSKCIRALRINKVHLVLVSLISKSQDTE